ncbi:hypothetical protein A8L45_07010 [Veronia pacifica]|uniref:Uncharacterized protein n=1 Tax=Veronia pacifica TaxID=1080227 RepID=A0A1C3EM34_9GAMM|nr:hypothetical protein A8L45_07010 [Veronia pacifica]
MLPKRNGNELPKAETIKPASEQVFFQLIVHFFIDYFVTKKYYVCLSVEHHVNVISVMKNPSIIVCTSTF